MWQVATGCALFEATVLAYLVNRNYNYDRLNAAFLSPFLCLASLQVLLSFVVDDHSDGLSCGRWSKNWMLSFAHAVCIIGVPYFWAWLSFVECTLMIFAGDERAATMHQNLKPAIRMLNMDNVDELAKVWPRRMLLRDNLRPKIQAGAGNAMCYFSLGFIYFFVRSYYPNAADWESWNLSWLVPGPICTTRGRLGFQVLPIAVYVHWCLKYILVLGFWVTTSPSYNCIPHPSLMPVGVEICGMFGILITYFLDARWASIWSLSTVGVYIFAIAEPSIFKKARVLDTEALAPEGDQLRQSFIFRLAWARFKMLRLQPWSDDVQCVEVHDEECKKPDEEASCLLSVPTLMTMQDIKPGKAQMQHFA